MRFVGFFVSCIMWSSAPAVAHEFWLEPRAYQIAPDATVAADFVNGEAFDGPALPFLPQRFENFILVAGADIARVTGRTGDLPALAMAPLAEGLHIATYQSRVQSLTYVDWQKFQNFIDHKDFGDIRSQHLSRGLPETGFKETYTRYAKTLIGVGDSAGADRRLGLETEIVALANPYTDDLAGGLPVQVYFRYDLRAGAQVELFEKAPDGSVTITLHRTDAQGRAVLPVRAGHSYLVDAVILREPSDRRAFETGAVWDTLWASLTFAVPDAGLK